MALVTLGLLLLLGAIWGASFMLIKVSLGSLGFMSVAALRVLVGSLVLLLIIRLRGVSIPRSPKVWGRFAVMGLLGIAVPFAAISWGTQYIPSALSAILNASMPLFTFILALMWGNESATWRRAMGLLIGFGGIVLLTAPQWQGGLQASLMGELAVVLAALAYAVAIVYAKRKLGDQPPLIAALGQVSTGALFLLPMMLMEQPWLRTPTVGAIGSVLILGVLGTSVAYVIYYQLVQSVGPTTTSIVTYITPVFSIFWGWLILAERLSWQAFAALGMIMVGLMLVNRLPVMRRRAA